MANTKAPSLADVLQRQKDIERDREAALKPIRDSVNGVLDGETFTAGIATLEEVADSLPANTGESQALRTLLQSVGHVRNVFRSGR